MVAPAITRPGRTNQIAEPIVENHYDAIERAIAESIAQKATPGATVGVMHAGVQVYAYGSGHANLETATPLTPSSILRIGSLTKQFTAAAAIKLAALGRLDLHAPVSRYLTGFSSLPPFSLLEAMHQTAGLRSDESDGAISCAVAPKSQIALAEEIAHQNKPFDFPPGTAWLYSNANYIVVGAVIEQITAMPLADAMAKLIFEPLALAHTAMDNVAEVVPDRASGYSCTDGNARPFVNAAWLDPSQAGGAGAMRSTVGDLCNWHHLLLSHRLFDRAHTDLMLAAGRLRDGRLSSANRFSTDDAHYGDTEYACGLLVSGPSEARPNILHYGAINGFCAVLQTWTDAPVTFACLCNVDIGPAVPFRGIRQAVIERWTAG